VRKEEGAHDCRCNAGGGNVFLYVPLVVYISIIVSLVWSGVDPCAVCITWSAMWYSMVIFVIFFYFHYLVKTNFESNDGIVAFLLGLSGYLLGCFALPWFPFLFELRESVPVEFIVSSFEVRSNGKGKPRCGRPGYVTVFRI
jgi:hypothetical protein